MILLSNHSRSNLQGETDEIFSLSLRSNTFCEALLSLSLSKACSLISKHDDIALKDTLNMIQWSNQLS